MFTEQATSLSLSRPGGARARSGRVGRSVRAPGHARRNGDAASTSAAAASPAAAAESVNRNPIASATSPPTGGPNNDRGPVERADGRVHAGLQPRAGREVPALRSGVVGGLAHRAEQRAAGAVLGPDSPPLQGKPGRSTDAGPTLERCSRASATPMAKSAGIGATRLLADGEQVVDVLSVASSGYSSTAAVTDGAGARRRDPARPHKCLLERLDRSQPAPGQDAGQRAVGLPGPLTHGDRSAAAIRVRPALRTAGARPVAGVASAAVTVRTGGRDASPAGAGRRAAAHRAAAAASPERRSAD
jgi:hypothetical protein